MRNRSCLCVYALVGSMLATSAAVAQTSVNYGKITAVKPVTVENPGAQEAGIARARVPAQQSSRRRREILLQEAQERFQ